MKKTLLQRLLEKEPHPKRDILGKFPRGNVARELSITPAYLGNILNGNVEPSKAINKKINALAKEIEAALAEEKRRSVQ